MDIQKPAYKTPGYWRIKKMKKKILCGMLAAMMVSGALASCGGDTSSTTSTDSSSASTSESASTEEGGESTPAASGTTASGVNIGAYEPNFDEDPYTVKFLYLLAQEGDHFDEIEAAASAVTMDELNIGVEFIPVTYGTIDSQLNMMLPAGEDLDVFTSFAANQGTYLDSGYILNWADYNDYLPNVLEYLGDDIGNCMIGDQWVVIPSNYERCAWTCYLVRNDILEDCGYTISDFDGIDLGDPDKFQEGADKLTELFAAVAEKHPEMVVLNGTMFLGTQTSCYVDGLSDGFGVLENYGQTTEVTNWFESEQWKNFALLNQQWFQAGYASQDIGTNVDSIETILKAGNTFAGLCNAKPNTVPEKLSQTGHDVQVIKLSSTMLSGANFGNGFCLSSASKDPVKAAAWYNYIFQSEEFNDLINWGIEGTDWVEDENGLAAYPEGADVNTVGYHNDYGWIYPNQMVAHAWEGNEPDVWDQYVDFNKGDYVSQGNGFRYDNRNVLNQVIACQAVNTQYQAQIVRGTATDMDAAIQEYNDALYAAGLQDIIDEKQSQLNAWLASKGE